MAFAEVASMVVRDSWELTTSFLALARTLDEDLVKDSRCLVKRTLRGVEEAGEVAFLEVTPVGVLVVERI